MGDADDAVGLFPNLLLRSVLRWLWLYLTYRSISSIRVPREHVPLYDAMGAGKDGSAGNDFCSQV
ncbi:hypothetical protein LEMLEM_LOCUS5160 [Lemmus lemmus]